MVIYDKNKTFDGKLGAYNNPIIPKGFGPVNTMISRWENRKDEYNKGLVIQDKLGNQFVWVPIDNKTVKYEKIFGDKDKSFSSKFSDVKIENGFDEKKLKNTYQGFYVSRYESSFDFNLGNIRVACKKSTGKEISTDWSSTRTEKYNGYLWNYINYNDAKFYSENMVASYGLDSKKIGTMLINGTQWDTIMKWIQSTDPLKSIYDSRSWGNYRDYSTVGEYLENGILHVSGYSENWQVNNIYDLAGNLWELSNEKSNNKYVYRGGFYHGSGKEFPAVSREYSDDTSNYVNVGFRVVLYLK
ncbi:hypothetical protein D3C73_910410 [compost metagenome]